MLKDIDDKSFQTINQDVIVIDFWAKWCGPCRIMSPIMEELASRWYGKGVGFYKMDIDESSMTASNFGIRSIPTVLILKDGEVADQIVGTTPISEIDYRLQKVLTYGKQK